MNEQIDMIIARKLTGEATADDVRNLDAWLAADDRHKAEYEQVAKLWQQSDNIFGNVNFDTNAAWNKVAAQTIHTAAPQKKTIAFPVWGRYAAAVAAILLLGIFIMKPFGGGMETVVADAGNMEVTLPDNTHVTLRKGSKLEYPSAFDKAQRNVSLEGEAFFEVTRNEKQPFVIDAQSVSVQVLGTSFNVDCEAAAAKVSVATGKVQMTSKQDKNQYTILVKGECGELAANKVTKNIADNANYLFWKTGILQYDNKALRYIAADLSYYYQKTVTIDSSIPANMQEQLINISFKNQSLEKALDELCLVSQCKWQQAGDGYTIQAK